MSTYPQYQIIIVGGGLAGLTNALHLAKAGLHVCVVEKESYPKHKVCGEYISNEVLPYLDRLGIDPFSLGGTKIQRLQLSSSSGRTVHSTLPLGGFGISRYLLDSHLCKACLSAGVVLIQDSVIHIRHRERGFHIATKFSGMLEAELVIGAYGKRSRLDVEQQRPFIQQRAPFLAVKRHMSGDFPEDLVALHNFTGGYCGVSKVEDGRINLCYLTDYAAFKRYRNIDRFEEEVVCQNPHLARCFQEFKPLFDQPLTISQVSFSPKETVHEHILMSGDSAGMIHPLCGNGMGMAISSAELLSDLIVQYYQGGITSRNELEICYEQAWESRFHKRLRAGRLFSTLFARNVLFDQAVSVLTRVPAILPFFVRQTHG